MDIQRKLASVRRIAGIDPIEGADKIICVTVDGWKLVSAKENGFQVGDLVIYFEIDSFLPIRPEFEWMRDRCYKNVPGLGEGFRVKTIKLRGQVSQGLIVPLTDFLQFDGETSCWYYVDEHKTPYWVAEGDDLTEFLGVKKYEKPIAAALAGRVRGNFPSFIRKTDEERIQNCLAGVKKWIFNGKENVIEVTDEKLSHQLSSDDDMTIEDGVVYFKSGDLWFRKEYIANDEATSLRRAVFEMTLKLDGSSMTVYHNDGQIGVCSRNLDLKRDPENAFWKCTLSTGLLPYLAQNGFNIAIQGELMGPGVQDNRENLSDFQFHIFNVFDIDKQEYWTPRERINWFDALMKNPSNWTNSVTLFHVESLGVFIMDENTTVDQFLELADETESINHPIAEGIVFKNLEPNGPSFKVISNKFLLKEKD